MTPSTTDQYQRAMNLLDDDGFWDRYLAELSDDQAHDARPAEAQQRGELRVVPAQADDSQDVSVRPTVDRGPRSWRSTTFQRAVIAAAAGIGIIAGITLLNTDRNEAPIEVFTPANPTATAEVPVVVVNPSPEPEATALLPTPAPEPTATPAPATTPEPEPTSESAQQPEAAEPEPAETEPQDVANGETESEAADSGDTEASEGSESASGEPTDSLATTFEAGSSSADSRLFTRMNELRQSRGLPALHLSPALSAVAQEQAWSLTNYQDTHILQHPSYTDDPNADAQVAQIRDSAWVAAAVLGRIDIEGRLPAGWTKWDDYSSQWATTSVEGNDRARDLYLGDFTHVGMASGTGQVARAQVVVFARYPAGDPAEPSVVVRTDGRCLARVASTNLQDKVIVESSVSITTDLWPGTMSHAELRICPGSIVEAATQTDIDSRFSVRLVRRSDGMVMGEFTCFAGNICDALIELGGSSAPFDIVFDKLSPEDFGIKLGQLQTAFHTTDGQIYELVAG